ncbi:major facilitator superfamily, putative [Plasmodium gallinaceum]|uniref:Major facilitator superfamily, putative n=1 Tax=Plasmodium gallinaceum TaxID=5849 RepID=A0A1J1GQ85_PLAGA|nr:major facilitator superfamily, putative [Plasmodium gallinaceum]CRG94603.1 major facilitator superfamily, putative [Plasmodium gallinaceum]
MKLLKDDENFFFDKEYEIIKKKTLFKILLSVFIKTLFESFLQPLLPFYILNYYNIEVKELGILLSFYSLSQCVMCLIIGFFSSVNKKYLLIFLLIFNLIGIYLLYMRLNFTFLIINRIICGSSSVFSVVVNAIINDLVDTNVCIYYTYINIFNAIGIILGPLLSSFFLTIFNFQIILNFNTLGLFISLFIILTISNDLLTQNKIGNDKDGLSNNLDRENITNLDEKSIEQNSSKNKDEKNQIINTKFVNRNIRNKNTKNYKNDERECLINSCILNTKSNILEVEYEEKNSNYCNEEYSIFSHKKSLKKNDYSYISIITLFLKKKLDLFINTCLSFKFKCLLSICLFRFTSAFSSNLMSNIFFVFYNDNVSSDNKQIQISVFVSLSGIIMIFYQYFSFSYILKQFGYNGTAIIGLLIQSIGILLTYHSIKYYNLIFQYISICFIHSCSYAYIEPIIPTIISLFFDKKDQLFSQSIVSFFRYLSLTISPIIYSYYYIENQLFPFFISSCMSIISIFFVILAFKFHYKIKKTTNN